MRIAVSPTCVRLNRLRLKQKSASAWRSGTRTLVLSKFSCSARVWPTIYCKRLGLLHRGTNMVRSAKPEQAMLPEVRSKQNGSRAMRA